MKYRILKLLALCLFVLGAVSISSLSAYATRFKISNATFGESVFGGLMFIAFIGILIAAIVSIVRKKKNRGRDKGETFRDSRNSRNKK